MTRSDPAPRLFHRLAIVRLLAHELEHRASNARPDRLAVNIAGGKALIGSLGRDDRRIAAAPLTSRPAAGQISCSSSGMLQRDRLLRMLRRRFGPPPRRPSA
jgi:hypothetical protein